MNINFMIVDKLKSIRWFEKCGIIEDMDLSQRYMFVEKEDDVLQFITSLTWKNYTLDALNDVSDYLQNNYKTEYRCWNKLVNDCKATVLPELKTIVTEQYDKRFHGINMEIIDDIEWNILGIIIAYSYQSFYMSDFYSSLYKIYKSGHIICGVKGRKDKKYFILL